MLALRKLGKEIDLQNHAERAIKSTLCSLRGIHTNISDKINLLLNESKQVQMNEAQLRVRLQKLYAKKREKFIKQNQIQRLVEKYARRETLEKNRSVYPLYVKNEPIKLGTTVHSLVAPDVYTEYLQKSTNLPKDIVVEYLCAYAPPVYMIKECVRLQVYLRNHEGTLISYPCKKRISCQLKLCCFFDNDIACILSMHKSARLYSSPPYQQRIWFAKREQLNLFQEITYSSRIKINKLGCSSNTCLMYLMYRMKYFKNHCNSVRVVQLNV